jgi:hypothetical protein
MRLFLYFVYLSPAIIMVLVTMELSLQYKQMNYDDQQTKANARLVWGGK